MIREKIKRQSRQKHSLFMLSLLIILSIFISFSAKAQDTTGNIEGTVTDESGARITGATVKIEGATVVRTAVTDKDGFFRILQVQPGAYNVTISANGFAVAKAEAVSVVIGKSIAINVPLKIAGVTQEILVSSDQIEMIDPTNNKIQTTLTQQLMEDMPKGNNVTSLLKLSPAARGETKSGGFQIDGASGSENNFMIDGMEVSNFRTGTLNTNNNLPFAMVQEVQISSSGFGAEFGGATGGVINVITKKPTNQYHGEAGIQAEHSALFAGPRQFLQQYRSGTGSSFYQVNTYHKPNKSDFDNYFPSFGIGGPIPKTNDKILFYTTYAPQIFDETKTVRYLSNNPATGFAENTRDTYNTKVKQEYFQGRLESSPFEKLSLSANYIWNPIIQTGVLPTVSGGDIVFGSILPSATIDGTKYTGNELLSRQGGRQNSTSFNAQAIWTPTANFISGFRFSHAFLNEKLNSYFIPNVTRVRCLGSVNYDGSGCTNTFDSTGGSSNFKTDYDTSRRRAFDWDATYVASNFVGRHEFKGGYQFSKISNDVSKGYSGGLVYLYYDRDISELSDGIYSTVSEDAIGSGYLYRYGTYGSASNTAHSLYIQDRWQPTRRLSLNLGLRMEKENLPSYNGYSAPINFGWGDKIVPRLGVAYDITGSGKNKLFFSFGRYTDRLKFELPRGSFGGDFYRTDYFEITADHPEYSYYTYANILGNYADTAGGGCPITGSTGLTKCQSDGRIASNDPNATIYTGAVDPNLKPFMQTEMTFGFERELTSKMVMSLRYSYKNVDRVIEDAGFLNEAGSEAYIIGNPGEGLYAQLSEEFGYSKMAKPQRRYDALEIKLDRRFSKNYQFNAAYTYSRLYGNYSGLASSDEDGRTSPGVNRFFDLPHIGFTASGAPDNGRLATDRPHVFNLSGLYSFNWFGKLKNQATKFSMFSTAQSGVPLTSIYTLYATSILMARGDLGRTPVLTNTDFAISHGLKFGGKEQYGLDFSFNVLNLFNEANVLNKVVTVGAINPGAATLGLTGMSPTEVIKYILTNGITDQYYTFLNDSAYPQRQNTAYGLSNSYQAGREMRWGVRFTF